MAFMGVPTISCDNPMSTDFSHARTRQEYEIFAHYRNLPATSEMPETRLHYMHNLHLD